MLHQPTVDGGLGFCHSSLPRILPDGYHGPLVVALDSNVLIDLREHGNTLMEGTIPEGTDRERATSFEAIARLLELWLTRDIRFIVTQRSRSDARRVTRRFLARHLPSIDAIDDSLAFQTGDWESPPPSERAAKPIGEESGLPDGADRDLVLEAQAIGAHVFLTQDKALLDAVSLSGPQLAVQPPPWLMSELDRTGAQPFEGGSCGQSGCPYSTWEFPLPDSGKWTGLLSVFDGVWGALRPEVVLVRRPTAASAFMSVAPLPQVPCVID